MNKYVLRGEGGSGGGGDDSSEFIMHHLRWQLCICSIFCNPSPIPRELFQQITSRFDGGEKSHMLPNVLKWFKKMDKGKVLGLKLVFYLLTFKMDGSFDGVLETGLN